MSKNVNFGLPVSRRRLPLRAVTPESAAWLPLATRYWWMWRKFGEQSAKLLLPSSASVTALSNTSQSAPLCAMPSRIQPAQEPRERTLAALGLRVSGRSGKR